MRTLKYILSDGTETTSYAEAVSSGKAFKVGFETETEKKPDLTPIAETMMKKYGYVRKGLAV